MTDRPLLTGPTLAERAAHVISQGNSPARLEVPRAAPTAYLTHGLFRYVGKLPPPLVAYLLHNYTAEGGTVIDPMCGGGTTAIEAASSGRFSHSFDINPVSLLATQALSRPADTTDLLAFQDKVSANVDAIAPPHDLADYYSPATYGLLYTGLQIATTPAEKLLILSIARSASYANTKKINTVVDPLKKPKSAGHLLESCTQRFLSAFEDLRATFPASSKVDHADAKALPLPDESGDFVLLHPPYLTNTAFSEATHLQLLLLHADPKKLRKRELAYRGSYFHVPNGMRKYLVGWAKIIREAARLLVPGGIVATVVGDGRVDGIRIPVGTITEELAGDEGLHLVQRAVHSINNQTGWTLSRRMTTQHVLVFRK